MLLILLLHLTEKNLLIIIYGDFGGVCLKMDTLLYLTEAGMAGLWLKE